MAHATSPARRPAFFIDRITLRPGGRWSSLRGKMMIPQAVISGLGYLIGLVALAGIAARLASVRLQRLGAVRTGHLARLETVALDPRRRLHLVKCGDRRVVLLVGGSQDIVVGWLPGP
jgi:hypothetical protein